VSVCWLTAIIPAKIRALTEFIAKKDIVRSESRCALRLRYVDLVVSIAVAVVRVLLFHCINLLNSG
jgi:hypothetical protein